MNSACRKEGGNEKEGRRKGEQPSMVNVAG